MTSFYKKTFGFPSTMWTDITRWKEASIEERKDTLHRFYERYQLPLLGYIRSKGFVEVEADDVFHDFVLRHIEGKIFISADPTRGRFRSLLLVSLNHFIISRKRTESAEKRHPVAGFTSLDEEIFEGLLLKDVIVDGKTPEEIYEKTWFLTILNNVLERLAIEYKEKGQDVHYTLFEKRIIQPILYGFEKPSIKDLSLELSLKPSEASNCIVTAKRAYQRHLRDEISSYASSEKEVSEEINDLRYFLQNMK
jgi:RNA polymerase sigma-70 factor (ECF subfamily)